MSQSQHMSPEMEQMIKQGVRGCNSSSVISQALTSIQPPYPPQGASIGGLPTVNTDVPALAVFIALYLTSAISNIIIFQRNRKRGHWFFISALLIGFSMARVLTCILRIVWACEPQNVSVAIAAQIFVNAGILLVYIINLLFAQRILRARRPEIGWNVALRIFFRIVYVLIGIALILIIVMTVYSFYTLDPAIHSYAKWMQRGAILFLFLVALTPLIVLPLAMLLPRTSDEHFGKHSMETKALILLAGACICTTIAGFKVGTLWSPPRAADNPAWYDSKAAFYIFNFTLEIILLSIYIPSRIDHKFHVPNGSSKRKTYRVPDPNTDASQSDDGVEKPESMHQRDSGLDKEGV